MLGAARWDKPLYNWISSILLPLAYLCLEETEFAYLTYADEWDWPHSTSPSIIFCLFLSFLLFKCQSVLQQYAGQKMLKWERVPRKKMNIDNFFHFVPRFWDYSGLWGEICAHKSVHVFDRIPATSHSQVSGLASGSPSSLLLYQQFLFITSLYTVGIVQSFHS